MFGKHRVRTPTMLQLEAVECGAVALGIILGSYGRHVPMVELRQRCGVSRDGSKASKIVQAARTYGMVARGLTRTLETLLHVRLPFIVFWQFRHFVVVEGFSPWWVYLNDPAVGHRKVTWHEFSAGYTGVVLHIEPGPDFRKGGQKSRLLTSIASRLRGNLGTLLFCLLAGILLTIPSIVVPIFTQIFIDEMLLVGHTSWIRPLLLAMGITVLLMFALKFLETTYLRRLMVLLSVQLSSRFFWHLMHLPMEFYGQRFPGEVGYRMRLNQKVAEVLSGKLASSVFALFTMILYVVVLLNFSVVLTAIGVGFACINFWAIAQIGRLRQEANLRLAQDAGKATGVAMAGLQGMETIKASAYEDGFFARWAGHYTKAAIAQQQLGAVAVSLGVLPTLLQGLALTCILVVGGFQVTAGTLTIGSLVAFQLLMQQFLKPVSELVQLSGTVQELEADLLRLDDVLENPVMEQGSRGERERGRGGEEENAGEKEVSPASSTPLRLQGAVELRQVTFGYSPVDTPLIQGFDLSVRPGQWLALVGSTGSGKSTLIRLIAGLFSPWSGDILLDGQRRSEIPALTLENSIGFVDQDILLFEGRVRDNLTLWDQTVPLETIHQACCDAMIEEDLLALPGGLDAFLQEGGANLSGGQRQRMEIARALLNHPSILVLDEATSSLDTETEYQVMHKLRQRGCTCILAAHRLSTIRLCDEILVLQNGQVIERGTHDQLWAAQGHYTRLIQAEES